MKIFALLLTSSLSVLALFMTMSSLATVDTHFDNSLVNGVDFYQNNSQIITEINMPYAPSDRYNPTVSFLNNGTFFYREQSIISCPGAIPSKPKMDRVEYQNNFKGNLPLKRKDLGQYFNQS